VFETLHGAGTEFGLRDMGYYAIEGLRIEKAYRAWGRELTPDDTPWQAGLGWAVKLDKGEFVGRDALLKRQQDTARPVRVGLELEGRRAAREGAQVLHDGSPVGKVTSGTITPTLNRAVAMAYVRPDLSEVGTALSVEVGKAHAACKVVALPFFRRPGK